MGIRGSWLCFVLVAASACIVQIPAPQESYPPVEYGRQGYSDPSLGYVPRSNTRWSDIGATIGAPAQAWTAATVNPASISREGIRAPVQGFLGTRETGFRVAYAPSQDPAMDQIRQAFKAEQVFDKFAADLNATLRMPRVIDIQLIDCGIVNAFYDRENSRIIICYEFIAGLVNMFTTQFQDENQLAKAIIGATLFAFFHELGHALRHQFDLPVTGKEEDAVDQLAALILMDQGEDGVQAVLYGAYSFLLQGSARNARVKAEDLPFWDEHSLDQQRFYSIACLIYGADPVKNAFIAESKVLPEQRAARCPAEYREISGAWGKLLAPHLRPSGEVVAISAPTSPRARARISQEITCAQVADHGIDLALRAYGGQLAVINDEQVQQLRAQLESYRHSIFATCEQQNWAQSSRRCVVRARTFAEAQACQ